MLSDPEINANEVADDDGDPDVEWYPLPAWLEDEDEDEDEDDGKNRLDVEREPAR